MEFYIFDNVIYDKNPITRPIKKWCEVNFLNLLEIKNFVPDVFFASRIVFSKTKSFYLENNNFINKKKI